jgi:hypothetical protein
MTLLDAYTGQCRLDAPSLFVETAQLEKLGLGRALFVKLRLPAFLFLRHVETPKTRRYEKTQKSCRGFVENQTSSRQNISRWWTNSRASCLADSMRSIA